MNVDPGAGRGTNPAGTALELRPQFRKRHPPGEPRLLGRLCEHLVSRRDHPSGRRSAPAAWPPTPQRFSPLVQPLYLAAKTVKPEVLGASAHRAPAVRSPAPAAGDRRQQHGQTASGTVSPRAAAADLRRAQRDRSAAAGSLAARRPPLRVPQPAGPGARRTSSGSSSATTSRSRGSSRCSRRSPCAAVATTRLGRSTCWSAAAAIRAPYGAWPAAGAGEKPFIFSVSIPMLRTATGRATSSCSRPTTTRARSWCSKPWRADCP